MPETAYIKEIFDIITVQGGTTAIFGFLIFFGVWWAWIKLSQMQNAGRPRSLKSHQFFAEVDRALISRARSLPVVNPFKRAVFEDIITIRFTAMRDKLSQLCADSGIGVLSEEELYAAFVKVSAAIEEETTREAERKQVPGVAVQKFRQWNAPTQEFADRLVREFCYSNFLRDNSTKVASILAAYTLFVETTLTNAERTVTSINGDMVGLSYKGITCEPDKMAKITQ